MEVDPAEVAEIRELWKEHSKAEDNRSIEGLLATLSEDCVYTVYPDDVSWHGHEGAARFYTELLTAFPDIVFELQNIVIGPQGVVEEAIVTGHAQRQVARQRADRRDDDLAERDLLPLGSGVPPLQGRAGLHRRAEEGGLMAHAFSSLDELGDGPGFRKVRGRAGDHGVRRQRRRLPARTTPGSATTTTPRTSSTSSTAARPRSRSTARSGSSVRAASSTSSRRRRGRSRASATTSSSCS